MIRRVLDLILIILFVWSSMIFGFWIIDTLIVPLALPIPGVVGDFVTSVAKVLFGTALALFWLWLWREMVKRFFWHIVKRIRVKN